jgi:hypothetical protein
VSFLILASWGPAVADVSATAERDAASAPQPLGYAAMPGGLRAPSAETLPAGAFGVAALGGYGFRNTLLSADHKLTRGIGGLALAFAPTELITLAVSFDGRYDKHEGLAPDGDDGYVGDPHIFARLGKSFGSLRAGAQLGVWVPGKDAPSVAASAISFEARGLLSVHVGPGTLSFNGGFRLDNSAKSVDEPGNLSAEDRVSLGVSDFHAAVAGAHLMIPAGKAFVGLEASTDFFVGSGAPGPIIRGGANGGINLTDQWSVFAFVQAAKVPELDYADVMAGNVTLVPYEPIFTGGIGLSARFGAQRGARSSGQVIDDDKPKGAEVIEYADVSGTVTDDTGKPVAGAKVTIKLKGSTGSSPSDAQGNYTIAKLAIGKTIDGQTTLDDTSAEVTVEVPGKKPKVTTLTLAKGNNAVAAITLDPVLPPGQLKAVIRAAGTGKPIAGATVKIEPGGLTATTDADGNISIDLPPGTYKATASGTGFKDQTLDVVIEKDGVIVKNFELRK